MGKISSADFSASAVKDYLVIVKEWFLTTKETGKIEMKHNVKLRADILMQPPSLWYFSP